jgi:CRP-like cAMP-binding protein
MLSVQPTPLSRPIDKNSILRQLVEAGPHYLRSRLHYVDLATNETIYNVGERVNYIYFPLNSVVSSLAVLKDRATVEISMHGNESLLGLASIFGPRTNQYCTRMCLGGRLAKLELEDLIVAFSENRQVAKVILQSYTALVAQISQRSACNAKHTVMERYCCWLLMVHDRVSDGSLRVTQELVASRLGTRRAGITVATQTLLEEQAIEHKRGLLRIKDRGRIEGLACECYSLLSVRSEFAQSVNSHPQRKGLVLPLDSKRSEAGTKYMS